MPTQEDCQAILDSEQHVFQTLVESGTCLGIDSPEDRLRDLEKTKRDWEQACEQLKPQVAAEEAHARMIVAARILIVLRRSRRMINGRTESDAKTQELLALDQQVADDFAAQAIASEPITISPSLNTLESVVGNRSLLAKMQSIDILSILPDLLETSKNCTDFLGPKHVERLRGEKLLIVTALSSGVLIMPFIALALNKLGVETEIESVSPRMSRGLFLDEPDGSVIGPLDSRTGFSDIAVIDDVQSNGKTQLALIKYVQRKYGRMPIVPR